MRYILYISLGAGVYALLEELFHKESSSFEHVPGFYERFVKRPLDAMLSMLGILILSPLFLVLALLVRFNLGKPVIFKQPRPTLNERIFTLYKFRTMRDDVDENGNPLPDEERLTPFGAWLRSTSLDELPEFFNILKGDMSIVGPRPQLVRDMVFMSPEVRERHSVRAGLTGLAQVSGRNNMSWEDRFYYDLQYVENVSFSEDFKIFCKTIGSVFRKEGITEEGEVTSTDYGDDLLARGLVSEAVYSEKQAEARVLISKM